MQNGKPKHFKKPAAGAGVERRYDTDGKAYTKAEFMAYYKNDASHWEKAKPVVSKARATGAVHEAEGEKPKASAAADRAFIPTGGERRKEVPFSRSFESHFWVPKRIKHKPEEFISTVNDWHYAMLNDHPRNEFYHDALKEVIVPGKSRCLEIGAGSGILSCIAAKLGAKSVIAIEANPALVKLSRQIIELNGYQDRVTVIQGMSDRMSLKKLGERPDVLMSELFGTLMLSESALTYVAQARDSLCAPNVAVVPARATQFAQLVCSTELVSLTSAREWNGINLSPFNTFVDTASLVFSKVHGFRFSEIAHEFLSDRIPIHAVDFNTDKQGRLAEKRHRVVATGDGVVHAVMASWEAYSAGAQPMSTHPDDTKNNLPRDMHWGQGIQLIEDRNVQDDVPQPFVVTKGEQIDLVVTFSHNAVTMQFRLERVEGGEKKADAEAEPCNGEADAQASGDATA